ncbi:hypothetical protein NC653_012446 [Populus alba x Populus x berolinensis]|uniref:Peptidase S26 domain-containing protein n=1 Tax=Populus alba x Populus x berolinensis TaxID=444605 RepID=A0AAD6QSF0_9ROSI|nr:hypothetical protein NC653_012446 [Populus alba x Populus x berolinensis]
MSLRNQKELTIIAKEAFQQDNLSIDLVVFQLYGPSINPTFKSLTGDWAIWLRGFHTSLGKVGAGDIVPKGHVWVEEINIYNSKDSRNFGAVPYGLLRGKMLWKVS